MSKDSVADSVSGLFDVPERIAVERALAEFRAGRPVLFAAAARIVAVPVDALDAGHLQSFTAAFASRSDLAAEAARVDARLIDDHKVPWYPRNSQS